MASKKTYNKYTTIGIPIVILALLIVGLLMALLLDNDGEELGLLNNKVNLVEYEKPDDTFFLPSESYDNSLIADNDEYALYFSGSNLSIRLIDKLTGATIESTVEDDDGRNNGQWLGFMKSGIVIDMIDGINDTVQVDLINNNNTIKVAPIDNGIYAKINFFDYNFGFDLVIRLEGDCINVLIPDETIYEDSDRYHIGAINLFPFLGYSYLDDKDGYMFIPDGNGALIYLNDKERRFTGGYSQMIYGEDTGFKDSTTASLFWEKYQTVNASENILAPVFGMVHTSEQIGFLGIVEEGASRASIEAYPNGVKVDYNRIYPKFIMRKVFKQPTSNSNAGTITQIERERTHYNIKVKYCFTRGEEADYPGLAVRYREYLIADEGLIAKQDASNIRIDFLGSSREEWMIFKKRVPMTTVDNIQYIYNELGNNGVDDILTVFKGWQDGGLDFLPVTKYKADKSIGGTRKLTNLINELDNSNINFYLYIDGLRTNPVENNTTFNVVKRVDKRLYEEMTYKEVYKRFLFLTPSRSSYNLNGLDRVLNKQGIDEIALGGITNHLFSYSYRGDYYSRANTLNSYNMVIEKLYTANNLALEQPFSYLWKYTDSFLDMPVFSSNYIFVDEEVPFISIALNGLIPMYSEYMNFEANKQEFYLNLIETGIIPSFYITYENSSDLIYTNSADIYSSMYDSYKEVIIQYYKEIEELKEQIGEGYIIDHKRLDNHVTIVSYDNGLNLYINYSNEDKIIDGYTIEGMSYKVGEAR